MALMLRALMTITLLAVVQSACTPGNFYPPNNTADLDACLKALNFGPHPNISLPRTPSAPSTKNCQTACGILEILLGSAVAWAGSPDYQSQQASYWSNQQAETQPKCRVLPRSRTEAAVAYLAVATVKCKFAVKAGGHAAFAGASSINSGVVIDLQKLNWTSIHTDGSIARFGAGHRWIDVYNYLSPKNLSVAGGRVSDIGVTGFTLGGGISFFSGSHGWACDNVLNYEIILANGLLTNVNLTSNPSLFWALRGGGSNFGIVTRIDFGTFPQGPLLGGVTRHPISANAAVLDAFNDFVSSDKSADPNAALIVAFDFYEGQWQFTNNYEYTKPDVRPFIFEKFFAIPQISSSSRIANISNITTELGYYDPAGSRQYVTTATFHYHPTLPRRFFDTFYAAIVQLMSAHNLSGFVPSLIFQPITPKVMSQMSKNGGNPLGLGGTNETLMLLDLSFEWQSPKFDTLICSTADNLLNRFRAAAADGAPPVISNPFPHLVSHHYTNRTRNLNHPFIYHNHASANQDVFEGYGAKNLKRLREISKEYDPAGVWQDLMPGGFKLYPSTESETILVGR